MPSERANEYREIRTLIDLAHEVRLARKGGTIPPWVYNAISNATIDSAEVLEHYRGQHIPPALQEAAAKVQRAMLISPGR